MPNLEQEIAHLYDQDVQKVVHLVESNPTCIVTGPHGSGKSNLLCPRVEKMFKEKGFSVKTVDSSRFYGSPTWPVSLNKELDRHFPRTKQGIAILDEAIAPLRLGYAATTGLLYSLQHRGYSVIPVIPYPYDNHIARVYSTSIWSNAEQAISGKVPPSYNLTPKLIDNALAEKLLLKPSDDKFVLTNEVITTVISRIPLHLRILNQIRHYRPKSIEDVFQMVDAHYIEWRSYTSEEDWINVHTKTPFRL